MAGVPFLSFAPTLRQVALAVSVWSLPPTFDMSVPSASTTQAFDTKVRRIIVQAALTAKACSLVSDQQRMAAGPIITLLVKSRQHASHGVRHF